MRDADLDNLRHHLRVLSDRFYAAFPVVPLQARVLGFDTAPIGIINAVFFYSLSRPRLANNFFILWG